MANVIKLRKGLDVNLKGKSCQGGVSGEETGCLCIGAGRLYGNEAQGSSQRERRGEGRG